MHRRDALMALVAAQEHQQRKGQQALSDPALHLLM
jgi:hypothetical protein